MSTDPSAGPVLALDEVSASYGPYRALFDVSFSVPPGAVVAVVGANGAGKSTVARVVSGLVPASSGRVLLGGRDVTRRRAFEIARMGLAHVTEGRSVFGSLTVEENLVLAFRRALGHAGLADALARSFDVFPRLGERRGQLAGTLSGGEQRMLALARVLVLHQDVLVVDELSLGLAPVVVDEVYDALERVRSGGTALVLIEQHVNRAFTIADHVVVLQKGRVAYEGDVAGAEARLDELVLGGSPRRE